VGALKQQAQAYMQAAKESAPLVQLNAAVEQKDNEIAALNQAVEELMEKVTALEAKPRKKKAG
jgi:ubiquinone biosynthesis protein UbiJ